MRGRILRLAGLVVFAVGVLWAPQAGAADWYDSNWLYRRKITIVPALFDSDLSNYPYMFKIDDAGDPLFTNAQSDGDDILFTDSDGTTKLNHEIEYYSNSTKELVAWVKIPSVSSTVNTEIYLYYGNVAASNQENVTAVWDSDFVMVQHLQETSGTHLDSTTNNNDGTPSGGVTQNATGRIDGADTFDGNNDYINIPDSTSLRVVEMTLEAWVYMPGSVPSGYRGIVQHAYSTNNWYGLWKSTSPNRFHFRWSTGDVRRTDFNTTISADNWYYVVGVLDPTADKAYCYLNGNLDKTVDEPSLPTPASGKTLIGAALNVSEYFDGTIDEVRISKVARSEDWIKATFRNLNSPGTYQTVGDPQQDQDISGRVFEDANFSGTASAYDNGTSDLALANVDVELYTDAGTYVDSATTAADGIYTFGGVPDGTYKVRVRSATIGDSDTAPKGTLNLSVPGTWPYPLPEMTWGNGAALYGGQSVTVDDTATGDNAGPGDTYVSVTVSGADVTGVDFGFAYNLIVNTADDSNADNVRSQQGSLRQFIKSSNAIGSAGGTTANTSQFRIPAAQLTAGVARITLSAEPAPVSDSGTVLDATTQTNNIGNTNAGVLGTGGTVGTGATSLSTIAKPEVEIVDSGGLLIGVDVQASSCTVRGFAIHGFGSVIAIDGDDGNIRVGVEGGSSYTGILIEGNVLGSGATSFSDPGTNTSYNIFVYNGAGTIRNNLIAFSSVSGMKLRYLSGGSTYLVENNEIRSNGLESSVSDGVDITTSTGVTMRGNLVVGHGGTGLDLGSNCVAEDNTVSGNGLEKGNPYGSGTDQWQGIRLGTTGGNTVQRNIIHSNYGAGILVKSGSTGNTISQNSIYANGTIDNNYGDGPTGQIGIDLVESGGDNEKGSSPYYTLNDSGDGDSGGNGLLNFPIIETATVLGGNLTLTGFARPGSAIEFFIAEADPSGFGEGKTYVTSLTEGGGSDTDASTGTYGPGPINGVSQGTDTTNRFEFTIPLPGGVSDGTLLTATATLSGATSEFSGNVTVQQLLPDIILLKTSQTVSDPVNGASNPKAIPGATVLYTLTATNQGDGVTDADTVVIIEPVPTNTELFVNDLGAPGSGPVQFTDGAVASGLAYTFTSLASTTDDVEFSNDGGATYTYTPVPDADGFDSAVTHLRVTPSGAFNAASGGSNPSFQIQFQVRVE